MHTCSFYAICVGLVVHFPLICSHLSMCITHAHIYTSKHLLHSLSLTHSLSLNHSPSSSPSFSFNVSRTFTHTSVFSFSHKTLNIHCYFSFIFSVFSLQFADIAGSEKRKQELEFSSLVDAVSKYQVRTSLRSLARTPINFLI